MNIGILQSVNSIKTESGCKTGGKCLFPHHEVDEQPNKKPKKSLNPQNGESDDKGAAATVKTVPQFCLARLRAIKSSEQREVLEKPEA